MQLKKFLRTVMILFALTGLSASTAYAQTPTPPPCELQRPVTFAGQNWESNLVLVEIERFIIEKGYDCRTEVLPIDALMGLVALENSDLDIMSEIWANGLKEPWEKAVATGKVQRLGDLFVGREAWYIPRYTAEKLPGLKHVRDLPKYKAYFTDPENPGKGRIYGCPAGWFCEITTTNLWKALKLQDSFTLFSPGSGASQKAALASAYQRKEDMVFYYWEPTPLIGVLDLVELQLPPYDHAAFQCLTDPDCADPQPSAFVDNPVFTAVSAQFAREAPTLTMFLSKITLSTARINKALAYMEETASEPDAVARWFLQTETPLWTQWVPDAVAARIKSAL